MNLECEFHINAIEQAEDISVGVSQPHSRAEPDVHSSQFGRPKWHRHKYDSLHSPLSAVKHALVLKPGRCVHGKRFKHCKICRYSTVLTNTPVSNVASGTNPLQSNRQQTVLYCAPGVKLTEGASANNFQPTAPGKTDLYSDPKGNISPALSNDVKSCDAKLSYSDGSLLTEKTSHSLPTGYALPNSSLDSFWKCTICGQIAPVVPVSLPQPDRQVSNPVPDSKRCKMCGQIKV
jgi:hypothetical protein